VIVNTPQRRIATVAVMLLLVAAAPGAIAQDMTGSADHPLFPTRMPGYRITAYKTLDYASYHFDNSGDVEGKYTRITYRNTASTHPGGLGIRRNYEHAIKAAGGQVVSHRGNWLVMKGVFQGHETWAEIEAADASASYFVTIVEKTTVVQVITAAQMGAAIDRDGFVPLDIQFDFGSAVLTPESRPVIAEITNLLKTRPSLRIGVEGHTDNVGNPEANKALSLARARAVVAAIVANGIDASRLTPAGFGQERPIADNRLEEGRAKNRRVELVRQ
jgi:OmpA-OmpF porin, OOP family